LTADTLHGGTAGFAAVSARCDGCRLLSEAGFLYHYPLKHTKKARKFNLQPSNSECGNSSETAKPPRRVSAVNALPNRNQKTLAFN